VWGYPYMVLVSDLRSEKTVIMNKKMSFLVGTLLAWLVVVIQVVQPIRWWALALSVSVALIITIFYARERKTSP